MSSLFDDLSDELFQILKGSGKKLILYDKSGNRIYDPKFARRVFAEPDKMMISVNEAGSDSEVKLYLSQTQDIKEVAALINTLRQISTRYNVLFNVRKYGRILAPRDFAYQVEAVSEAAMWGSTKTSYQRIGSSKLIVRHAAPVNEGIIGSRARNILALFVETREGERFRFPVIHLSGARAFAQHLNQGGKPYDSLGQNIVESARESTDLAKVNRYIRHSRGTLSEGAMAIRPLLKERIATIRRQLQTLARPRGYGRIQESGVAQITLNLQESEKQLDSEISRISELLNIQPNHALAESIMPVALLTLGDTIMKKINEMFYKGIAVPASLMQELAETLNSEYGYTEGVDWSVVDRGTHRAIYFENSAAMDDAHDLLENVMAVGYLPEDDESDKVLFYAQNWYKGRNKAMGVGDVLSKDQEKASVELADGLRSVLSGQPIAKAHYPRQSETPSFASADSQRGWELSLFLEPSAGLRNDALFTYISTIVGKLQEGQKLTSTEKMIMDMLVNQVVDEPMGESLNEDGDQIQTYATNWVAARHGVLDKDIGINQREEEKDMAKAAAELADGLRAVLSGQTVAHAAYPDKNETPSFTSMESQFAYELGLFLEPSAGLKNDSLFNYIGTLITKLQDGSKLTKSERLVMDKLLDTLDDSSIIGESSWDDPYDDRNDSNVESKLEQEVENFDAGSFMQDYFPELLNDRGDVEDPFKPDYFIGEISHYLNKALENADLLGYDGYCKPFAQAIWDSGEIQKVLADNGWTVTGPEVTESTNQNVLNTAIDFNDMEVEVEVHYDFDADDSSVGYAGDGIILTGVILKGAEQDIMDQLDDNTKDRLYQEVMDDTSDKAGDRADYEYDRMKDERAMGEDIAVDTVMGIGQKVATDFGPGTIVDVDGERALVELMNGRFKEIMVSELTSVAAPSMSEEADLDTWFEDFEPKNVLAQQVSEYAPPSKNEEPIEVGDRVVHGVYGPGEVMDSDGKLVKVQFDRRHARLGMDSTATISPGLLYKATGAIFKDKMQRTGDMPTMQPTGMEEEQITELSVDAMYDYFDRAAQKRYKLDKKAAHGDEEADEKMGKLDKSLELAWNKIHKKQGLVKEDDTEAQFDEAVDSGIILPGDQGDAFMADITQHNDVDGGMPGQYKIYGKTFDTKTFDDAAQANEFMKKNEGWGVIGVKDGKVHVAAMDDEVQEAMGMHRLLTLSGRKGN